MPKQQSLRYQVGDYIIGRTLGEARLSFVIMPRRSDPRLRRLIITSVSSGRCRAHMRR